MSKSFLRGMKNAFNLFPLERKVIVSLPQYSNEEALKKDLEQVGADMHFAIMSMEQMKNSSATSSLVLRNESE